MAQEVEEVWSFAVAHDGELHVIVDGELPPAENVVNLRIRRDGALVRIARTDLPQLRQLIGTEVRHVPYATGPDVVDELERMLDRVTALVRGRIDEITGDAETEDYEPPSP